LVESLDTDEFAALKHSALASCRMSPKFANWFGVAGSTLAIFAVAASGYAIRLPYRLSPAQMALLDSAAIIQFAGSLVSLALGGVALGGDARSRRFGFAAIALATIALLSASFAPQAHSTSRW
jgi:hypothetical protein